MKKIILEFFFFYFPENYSRRVCKSTYNLFWPKGGNLLTGDINAACEKFFFL